MLWGRCQGGSAGWFCARRSAGISGPLLALKCFRHPKHILVQPSTSFGKEALAGARGKCKRPDQLCSVALWVFLSPGATLEIALSSFLTLPWPQLQSKFQLLPCTRGLTKELICKPLYLLPLFHKYR